MRSTIINLIICCLLLCAAFAGVAGAQERMPKTHVFLLDESKSMENDGRYNNLRSWLIAPLLKSGAFEPGDSVIVRWFSQKSSNVSYDPNDDDLKLKNEKFDEQKVLNSIPGQGQALKGNTDIPQALRLVMSDINERYKVTGDVLIWIITDNNQDKGGAAAGSDISPFYNLINENRDKLFRAAYLFPLVKENRVDLTKDENAMIMYLLHYSALEPNLKTEDTDRIARDVAQKIDNPVITWFPFEKSFAPSFEGISDENAFVNGTDVIEITQPLLEGVTDIRSFTFKLKSRARQRKISGKISNETFILSLPTSIAEDGKTGQAGETPAAEPPVDGAQADGAELKVQSSSNDAINITWQASIFPKELSLKPDETSAGFTVSVTNNPLRPASFWNAVWNSTSEPISGRLQFELSDLQTEIQQDNSALLRVRNTEYIKDIVQKSVEKPKPFSYDVEFRLAYNSGWRRMVAGLVGLLLIAIALGLFLATRIKTPYELTTPSGERTLTLPLRGKEFITLNGERAAVISKSFGKLSLTPLGNYSIDGATGTRPLPDNGDGFVIEHQDDGRRFPHSLRRLSKAATVQVVNDDFLD